MSGCVLPGQSTPPRWQPARPSRRRPRKRRWRRNHHRCSSDCLDAEVYVAEEATDSTWEHWLADVRSTLAALDGLFVRVVPPVSGDERQALLGLVGVLDQLH